MFTFTLLIALVKAHFNMWGDFIGFMLIAGGYACSVGVFNYMEEQE